MVIAHIPRAARWRAARKEQLETLNEELETLNAQTRELESTIANSVAAVLAASARVRSHLSSSEVLIAYLFARSYTHIPPRKTGATQSMD